MAMNRPSYRLLADNITVSNDTRVTHRNNIDLIIGSSGSGKSGGYVVPNIMVLQESAVITDPKGCLYDQCASDLRKRGFEVYKINMIDPDDSSPYNPLDYIRYDQQRGCYREQDILCIANMLIKDQFSTDPFWERSAQMVLACLIAYVMEAFEPEEKNMGTVADVFRMMEVEDDEIRFLEQHSLEYPNGYAAKKYRMIKRNFKADKTWSCIQSFVSVALDKFDFNAMRHMMSQTAHFHFKELGQRKIVVFINTSDTDGSLDDITSLIYTQALHALCAEADQQPGNRLRVPVRLILDDFAASAAYIPDFDKLVSVLRSREISVSCILQSLSQLKSAYGADKCSTILNNSDTILFLGCTDMETVNYIATRVGTTPEKVMTLESDKAFLLLRGEKGRKVTKIKPYSLTPEKLRKYMAQQNEQMSL
ncbi:MAG: type IV secretory system conjugative DNA transfer family protein [Acutalibacteraceae bacterium]|nr:type IV secretory system conjugative DNA transfer family protein [Acutalibacteraceae bacterium]